jgi:hypothetical protein
MYINEALLDFIIKTFANSFLNFKASVFLKPKKISKKLPVKQIYGVQNQVYSPSTAVFENRSFSFLQSMVPQNAQIVPKTLSAVSGGMSRSLQINNGPTWRRAFVSTMLP